MNRKIGIFIIASSLLGFIYLTWVLMDVCFGLSFLLETKPTTIEEQVSVISSGILQRWAILFSVYISLQYISLKYLVKAPQIIKRMIFLIFITLGATSMIYGYQVSVYIKNQQKLIQSTP